MVRRNRGESRGEAGNDRATSGQYREPPPLVVAARYEYGPFGERLSVSGPQGHANGLQFSGKYVDRETELVNFGYR